MGCRHVPDAECSARTEAHLDAVHILLDEGGEVDALDGQGTVDESLGIPFLGVVTLEFLEAQTDDGAAVLRKDLKLLA